MIEAKKSSCCCSCSSEHCKTHSYSTENKHEKTLADLPVGASGTIVRIIPESRGRKKFADVGLVPGTELLIEAHAPFGGLIRVKVMESSMALHRDEAQNIVIRKETSRK